MEKRFRLTIEMPLYSIKLQLCIVLFAVKLKYCVVSVLQSRTHVLYCLLIKPESCVVLFMLSNFVPCACNTGTHVVFCPL